MDAAALGAYIREHFTRTAFRLETLQQYEVASDGTDFGRYLAGEPGPTTERKQPWLERLGAERAAGLARSRVRIVTRPVTDYTRYECEWGYAPNVDAGEDVLILDVADVAVGADEIDHLTRIGDFWLIDDDRVVVMAYGPDGQFLGARTTSDLDPFLAAARRARSLAVPFRPWWNQHREYHRDATAA